MFSTLRTRFGIPGVISVMALVFAMFGGAYAASNSSDSGKATASAKAKKGPRGPKGATGPAGPAGPAGAKGDPGAAGASGSNGADGKTVLNGAATPGAPVGTVGDFYIETDVGKIYGPKAASGANGGWGSGTDLKGSDGADGLDGADGADGSPWTAGGTLPAGATETGTYAAHGDKAGASSGGAQIFTPISFPIPLSAGLGGAAVHFPTDSNFGDFDGAGPGTQGCTGSFEAPSAPSGNLCLYPAEQAGVSFNGVFHPDLNTGGTTPAGALLFFQFEAGESLGVVAGSWAVTG